MSWRGFDMMNREILKTVATMDNLDISELKTMKLGVEIQDFTEPNLSLDEKRKIVKFYKKELKEFNGIKSIHGPFLDLRPASPDKEIRKVSYKRYLDTLKAAVEIDVDYIIFHSQINPYLDQPWMNDLNNNQHKESLIKLLEEVADYKGKIIIENIFEEEPRMLKELIQTIDLPNVKINLDIGHAKLGKVSLEEWIRELKDYIVYMHIHSNNGLYDMHSMPSKEEIDELYILLDKYKINPILSLEYKMENLEEEMKKYRSED